MRLSVHAAHAHAGHGEGEQGQRELRHVARGPGRWLPDDLAQVVVAHHQQDGFTPADSPGIAQEGRGQGHMRRFGPEGFRPNAPRHTLLEGEAGDRHLRRWGCRVGSNQMRQNGLETDRRKAAQIEAERLDVGCQCREKPFLGHLG